jgi:DUF4097 and DUF4098 domain-containing protein YvlB
MPEFPCDGPVDASIHVASGSVQIVAESRSTVQVTVEPQHNNDAGRAAVAATRIDLTGNALTVEVPKTTGFIRRGHSLRVSVRLPLDSRINLGSASADVTLSGRYGSSAIKTASGDIRVDEVGGDLSLNSASGDSEIGHVTGNVKAHTASGDIRIKTVGSDLLMRSASGTLGIDSVGGSIEGTTASGDIRVGAIRTGVTDVHSVSGDVKIGVVEGTAVWLDVNTISGDTRSELAVSDSAPTDQPATLKIQIRTVSGDVLIRRAIAAPVQTD